MQFSYDNNPFEVKFNGISGDCGGDPTFRGQRGEMVRVNILRHGLLRLTLCGRVQGERC